MKLKSEIVNSIQSYNTQEGLCIQDNLYQWFSQNVELLYFFSDLLSDFVVTPNKMSKQNLPHHKPALADLELSQHQALKWEIVPLP